ncbi:MAG TPA: hypothetical protein QGG59_06315 [Planctomycetota bacterium]|jgi:hypothetical protein|nr:hypothetical protein [Planctomycetota bacterium]MDP7245748.1 hypothetical protein [Planctomycetota bacterium]HJM39712.1 hypothetical protein [Planctomycetota bacterium]|tara:strand:+ start:14430 stop:15488 length:1059 start_codon:yes stop_codon:yes gene_type:complete
MNPLEGLLKLCDQIDYLQTKTLEGKPDLSAEEIARKQAHALREEVYSRLPSLREHSGANSLADTELLVLALLFHRRLAGDDRMVDGGTLVGLLGLAGYPRSEALEKLRRDGRLRKEGWLQIRRQPRGFDPVDTWFSATSSAFSLFWEGGSEKQSAAQPLREVPILQAYRDEEDYLWDLYAWRNQCIVRAEALFPGDTPGGGPSPRFRSLRQDARTSLTQLRRRLAMTPHASDFSIEKFRRKYKLGLDHQLAVIHLLFSELVEGESFISAIECLRVISETRHDLFRKRSLLSPRGRLRRKGIVVASEANEFAKALATDLTLADWVSDELVSGLGGPPRLDDQELDDFLQGDDR